MPKFSKAKKEELNKLLKEIGCSEKIAAALMRNAQAETPQDTEAATKEMRKTLLEELRQQHQQGVRFGEADLQEFLGQDEIPPEFRELLKKNKAPTEIKGPIIVFEPPVGCSTERFPYALHILKGREPIGEVTVIDDRRYRKMLRTHEIREKEIRDYQQNKNNSSPAGGFIKLAVQFRDLRGFKFCYTQTSPFWKRVDYLLEVPGGKVGIMLSACGKDFDEAPFEEKFHTLRISEIF